MRPAALLARLRRTLTVGLSVAAVSVSLVGGPGRPAPVPVRVWGSPPLPRPLGGFVPETLAIPRLGVRAPVVPVLTLADGTMGSPTNGRDVGWWPGRRPGLGNALFDAHHDWNGEAGSFYRLDELGAGDSVIVTGGGHMLAYTVVWTKEVGGGIDATDLLGDHPGRAEVTLVTCGGAFDTATHHHVDRIVVRAELVWA